MSHAALVTTITIKRSGWYTLRAWGTHARHPVLDIYPFATTSPIYVRVGDETVRSPGDAAYFVRWIDRLDSLARVTATWNSIAERDSALGEFAAARRIFAAPAGSGENGAPAVRR